MPRPPKPPTFAAARQKLTELGCTCSELPDGHLLVRRGECAAILAPNASGGAEIATRAGVVVLGELSRLIDRGYQKFFKTADAQVPARPEQMSALAAFQNMIRYACGIPALYNESLGSVSDRYIYDRVWFRDEGRQPRPWEQAAAEHLRG